MIYINGIKCETIEQVEEQIAGLSDYVKTCIRNDFLGVTNPPPAISVPQVVTPRQIRIALISKGITLDVIENMINSLPEPQKSITRVTWEYSVEFQRNNPMIMAMAPLLNLTQSQIDDIFILAATL